MYHIVFSALVFSLTGKVLQYIVTSFVHTCYRTRSLIVMGTDLFWDINQSVIIHIIKVLILIEFRDFNKNLSRELKVHCKRFVLGLIDSNEAYFKFQGIILESITCSQGPVTEYQRNIPNRKISEMGWSHQQTL